MLWSRLSSVSNNNWVIDQATDPMLMEEAMETTMMPTTFGNAEPFEKTIGFKTVDEEDLTDGDLIVPLVPQDYALNTPPTHQKPVSISYHSSLNKGSNKRPKKPKKPWKNKPQSYKKPEIGLSNEVAVEPQYADSYAMPEGVNFEAAVMNNYEAQNGLSNEVATPTTLPVTTPVMAQNNYSKENDNKRPTFDSVKYIPSHGILYSI